MGDAVELLHQAQHSFQVLDHALDVFGLFQHVGHEILVVLPFIFWVVPCMLIMNGIEVCSMGVPCGRVIACTREIPSTRKMAFAILSMTRKSAELRRS